jgi:hypothetical protein
MMKRGPDGLFLLFFRVMYLTIFTGFICFSLLGFAAIGTNIGIAATVVVAVGSEIAFVLAEKEEADKLMQERYLV